MKNLTLFTYTNSRAKDLHNIFIDRQNKYFSKLDAKIFISDIQVNNYTTSLYKEEDGYYNHILNGLKLVNTDYILFSQEDYILFNNVDNSEINRI